MLVCDTALCRFLPSHAFLSCAMLENCVMLRELLCRMHYCMLHYVIRLIECKHCCCRGSAIDPSVIYIATWEYIGPLCSPVLETYSLNALLLHTRLLVAGLCLVGARLLAARPPLLQ